VSRRRRGVLLLGLALVLGGLAASDVSRREAALERRLGPPVPVVVAARDVAAGAELRPGDLALRRIPARYAPAEAFASPGPLVGARLAAALPAGAFVSAGHVGGGDGGEPVLRPGERIADVVAVGSPEAVAPGGRVDVVVTREGEAGERGESALALEDVEVLAVAPADEAQGGPQPSGAPRVAASLRVTVRQAVYLAAAQSFARELRLLPRAPGDRERGAAGLEVGAGLG
jgi:pilus assembly protein CpaB